MHSAKCVLERPAEGVSSLSSCVDFAAEYLREGGVAFRSTATFFDAPTQVEAVMRVAAKARRSEAKSFEEAIYQRRDALRLVGKCVDVLGDTDERRDEKYLLPQLAAMLAALRGTAGCVLIQAAGTTLCIGVDGEGSFTINESISGSPRTDDDDDDQNDENDERQAVPAKAMATVCYDAEPRPLFKLQGASALRFTSVRGLQLHVLAVLSSLDGPATKTADVARLALAVSAGRKDTRRLERTARDIAKLRKTEKKRAIAKQRADIEKLRDRLRSEQIRFNTDANKARTGQEKASSSSLKQTHKTAAPVDEPQTASPHVFEEDDEDVEIDFDAQVELETEQTMTPTEPRRGNRKKWLLVEDTTTGDPEPFSPQDLASLLSKESVISSTEPLARRRRTRAITIDTLEPEDGGYERPKKEAVLSSTEPLAPRRRALAITADIFEPEDGGYERPKKEAVISSTEPLARRRRTRTITTDIFEREDDGYERREGIHHGGHPETKDAPSNEEDWIQAALAAYSEGLCSHEEGEDAVAASREVKDDITRTSLDRPRTGQTNTFENTGRMNADLLASVDGEDAMTFGARLYEAVRGKTLSDDKMAALTSRDGPLDPLLSSVASSFSASPPQHTAASNAPSSPRPSRDDDDQDSSNSSDKRLNPSWLVSSLELAATADESLSDRPVEPSFEEEEEKVSGKAVAVRDDDDVACAVEAVNSFEEEERQYEEDRKIAAEAKDDPGSPEDQEIPDAVVVEKRRIVVDADDLLDPAPDYFADKENVDYDDVDDILAEANAATFDFRSRMAAIDAKSRKPRKKTPEERPECDDDDVAEEEEAASLSPAFVKRKVRPSGWAATIDLAAEGDSALIIDEEQRARNEKMQRFNAMRAKKQRDMEERRRLEKEHRSSLRAETFGDDDDDDDIENDGGFRSPEAARRTSRNKAAPSSKTAPIPKRRLRPETNDDARQTLNYAVHRRGPPPTTHVASIRKHKSNKRTITNALIQVCLAGPHCAITLADALSALDRSHADNHAIVLKDDSVHAFRGLYAIRRGPTGSTSGGGGSAAVNAEKIFGRGPPHFPEAHVATFYKYNSANRAFQSLPARSFTPTTDAIVLTSGSNFRARGAPTF